MDSKKFYGVYRGTCVDINDPLDQNRIRLQVPQVLGQEITNWAYAINPITNNSNHPDHIAHTAAQVAALLTTHSISGTTGAGGTPSHTHSISLTAAHTGNTGSLKHPHVSTVSTSNLWNDSQETTIESEVSTAPEHTFHRLIPALNQGVWVMFEGGDPNFPLWIGVF